MFKQAFKYYKRKTPGPDLQDVTDFSIFEENNSSSRCNSWKSVKICERNIHKSYPLPVGLRPQHMWQCYMLVNHPGVLVIRNPFTFIGQRYWIARSLRDYPQEPNIVNLNTKQFSANIVSDWWGALHHCADENIARRLKTALRWTTLGYHHNWETKVYNEEMYTTFPSDLSSLCKYFSLALGFQNFAPQAAIINYYPIGASLSGHTDNSELNLTAPLFSYSFGQAAIFLIGGMTLEEEPNALFLNSGDVLIMSEESRLCYHAVPRVMKTHREPWNETFTTLKGQYEDTLYNSMDSALYNQVNDDCFWMPFNHYIKDSRININVRQVLPSDV